MIEWLVCSTRDGDLSLMSREEREILLKCLMFLKIGVPHFVVKVFYDKSEAEQYIKDQKEINDLLDNL